ncbi:cathepsin L-like isoform X2 [Dendropsophus ebraccatus]|uniref:cathepsin L-like isoform X2 n=1 Tax=Dendropsophus ebraccatus TaxID=150705 RepID=UPI0038320E5D
MYNNIEHRMHLEKFVLILSFVTCVLSSKLLDQEWKAWKVEHGKEYSSFQEEVFRRKAWEATWHKVLKHNQLASQGLSRYRMGMNKFADMTPAERTSRKCFHSNRKSMSQSDVPVLHNSRALNIPDSVDWRDSKCVTPVKNQGLCGSCWAFATVGVFESLHCIATKELVEFSEQQLVDCDGANDGCCGGLPEKAMAYVSSHGVMKAKDYEYSAKQFKCLYKPDNAVTLNVTKYYVLPGEDNMAVSLALNGPIAVGIDASDDLQMYSGGIFDGECSTEPNHAVIIVGYGTEHDKESDEDVDYWIIRNSWGEDWGENGYGKMRRNENQCGIATDSSSVDLTS